MFKNTLRLVILDYGPSLVAPLVIGAVPVSEVLLVLLVFLVNDDRV